MCVCDCERDREGVDGGRRQTGRQAHRTHVAGTQRDRQIDKWTDRQGTDRKRNEGINTLSTVGLEMHY